MDKVRVGIVGSKFAADFHCDCYNRDPRVAVAAVAAIDNLDGISARWNIPATYDDYNAMMERENLDLVSVCVPNFLHHDVVLAAAAHGVNVVCEKPMATCVADAQEMVKTCADAGVKLFYAEDWVFTPALRRAAEIIDGGGIGEVLYVKAREIHNGSHSEFARKKSTCGGGALIHLAAHPIGWVLQALGGPDNPVVEVTAKTTGGLDANYVHKDFEGEDWAMGVMTFRDGRRALVEGNYVTVGGMDDCVEIYGTDGRMIVDLTFSSPIRCYSRQGIDYAIEKTDFTHGWTRPAVDEFYNLGYVHELRYFVDCVVGDRQPAFGVDGACGVACVSVIEAMYTSAAEGRSVMGQW
jgi:predicted dehydrogenase